MIVGVGVWSLPCECGSERVIALTVDDEGG